MGDRGMKRFLALLIVMGFGVVGLHQAAAEQSSRPVYEKTGNVIWDRETDEKMIALTFDDGPDPQYTPEILEVLAKHNAKATFFVLGMHAKQFPNIVHRQMLEGHEIGNHTYHHIYSIKSKKKLQAELDATADVIEQITKRRPQLYRPVGGDYNDLIIDTAVENDYLVVLWSWHQDTHDWKNPGVDKIVDHVLSGIGPGDVILFHDSGGDRSQTVDALDKILTELDKEGYEYVTMSQLLARSETPSRIMK